MRIGFNRIPIPTRLCADTFPRLLSQNGIPKLRRTAKTKLQFKGKGHEVRYVNA